MSKSKRSRRKYTTEQRVAILREHLVDKVPVSEVCNQARPSTQRLLPSSTSGSARFRTTSPRR
jgi:transposase-like protein